MTKYDLITWVLLTVAVALQIQLVTSYDTSDKMWIARHRSAQDSLHNTLEEFGVEMLKRDIHQDTLIAKQGRTIDSLLQEIHVAKSTKGSNIAH